MKGKATEVGGEPIMNIPKQATLEIPTRILIKEEIAPCVEGGVRG